MADTLITGTTLIETSSRSVGDSPIGSIVSWLKSFTGVPSLPAGWVECNGQTLSDPLSAMNGQVIPDLNGDNRFVRGNSTSGGTGGTATDSHNHQWAKGGGSVTLGTGSGGGTETSYSSDGSDKDFTGGTAITGEYYTNKTTIGITPPYYNVVWVMRVR